MFLPSFYLEYLQIYHSQLLRKLHMGTNVIANQLLTTILTYNFYLGLVVARKATTFHFLKSGDTLMSIDNSSAICLIRKCPANRTVKQNYIIFCVTNYPLCGKRQNEIASRIRNNNTICVTVPD